MIFIIHGGGFISLTTASVEVNFCEISHVLDIPVISIDYSLTPAATYPRALEEVFYFYCWVLKNAEKTGSTLERIIFYSESAGTSLGNGVIIKCIENGIRLPEHHISFFGAGAITLDYTPSMFFTLMDPLLSLGFIMKIFSAYILTDNERKFIVDNNLGEFDFACPADDVYLNPLLASDKILRKFPSMTFAAPTQDSCHDRCIELAKKLDKLGIDVRVKAFKGFPHGFLGQSQQGQKECHDGVLFCIEEFRRFML